jgi:MarR family 2-MHQ and catechol resistance regulon transcriptional repressor
MDRLESQGLVARFRSRDDRRVVHATLTDEGRALVASVFPEHAEYIEHLCRHLDAREQEELRALLKQLGKGIAREDLPRK